MGFQKHHVIVCESWEHARLQQAHDFATKAFKWVSPISPEVVNGSRAFFIPPDGSKEGWGESAEGDRRRELFKAFLRTLVYEDGSAPISWFECWFGGDDKSAELTDDAWKTKEIVK